MKFQAYCSDWVLAFVPKCVLKLSLGNNWNKIARIINTTRTIWWHARPVRANDNKQSQTAAQRFGVCVRKSTPKGMLSKSMKTQSRPEYRLEPVVNPVDCRRAWLRKAFRRAYRCNTGGICRATSGHQHRPKLHLQFGEVESVPHIWLLKFWRQTTTARIVVF